MEEPTVLDYVKSRLRFGRGEKIEIPDTDNASVDVAPQQADNARSLGKFPWPSLTALLLGLIGQSSLASSQSGSWGGWIFYLPALSLLILAWRRGEWMLPVFRQAQDAAADARDDFVNLSWLFLGALFALAAFITFGRMPFLKFEGNQFTALNLTLWLLAIFFTLKAFWQTDFVSAPIFLRIKTFLSRQEWRVTFSRWTLLVLAASAIVLFFRLYQIGSVPAEPFSDHAEKLLDVYDITQGHTRIFFPRNTGREAIQMYWTLLIAAVFQTGLSFLSLKLGTALIGLLTLPFVYLLGKEVANRRVGLLAMFLMGVAYWPNVISRVGLRFPLYPLFVAPMLYYLLRGIRRQERNDFILAGIFLGMGAHGYSPFRIVPVVVLAAIGLYLLHRDSRGKRLQTILRLIILVLFSLLIFLPLGRYALEYPESFSFRASSRLGDAANPLPGVWWQIFAANIWAAMKMFNVDNGNIWVHSIPGRPALDVVGGALFLFGVVLLVVRYLRKRHWLDLFLLLSIVLLQLPSTLSLAYPMENPSLNRTAGAAVVVFLVMALALDGLWTGLRARARRGSTSALAWGTLSLLLLLSSVQNYNLVFDEYATQFKLGAWNTSEMGEIISQFELVHGETDSIWIVPYPHWVDTRLPGVWAGIPNRDFALWPDRLADSLAVSGPKLFMVKPEDEASLARLAELYPQGTASRHFSDVPGRDFWVFSVP